MWFPRVKPSDKLLGADFKFIAYRGLQLDFVDNSGSSVPGQ
jgi:hypothetical protein